MSECVSDLGDLEQALVLLGGFRSPRSPQSLVSLHPSPSFFTEVGFGSTLGVLYTEDYQEKKRVLSKQTGILKRPLFVS